MTLKKLSAVLGISVPVLHKAISSLGIKMKRGPNGTDFTDGQIYSIKEKLGIIQDDHVVDLKIKAGKNNPEYDEDEEMQLDADEIIDEIEKEELVERQESDFLEFDIEEDELEEAINESDDDFNFDDVEDDDFNLDDEDDYLLDDEEEEDDD